MRSLKNENLLANIPKTERGKETLNRICSAAEQLFYKKGYYKTSINDITNLASVGSGTFYIYFAGKLDLYQYLLLQYGHQIRRHIGVAVSKCTTRREAERVGLKSWFEFTVDHKHVFNIIWESLYIDKQLYDDYYTDFAEAYIRQLDAAKLKGEVRDIDSEVLSYVLMGIANFLGLNWVYFKGETDFDYVIGEVMKIIEGGMFADPKNV